MFKGSEMRRSRLIIYSQPVLGSLVVMVVEGFYSGRSARPPAVTSTRCERTRPLPPTILGNCGCFASKATGVILQGGGGGVTGRRRSDATGGGVERHGAVTCEDTMGLLHPFWEQQTPFYQPPPGKKD